jgi:hypothetical protein
MARDPPVAGATASPRHNVWAMARAAFEREPGLVVVGCAGLVLSVVCLVGVAVRGRFIPPEGKLLDAATFCFGVGVYTLTIALLLPLAGYSPSARRRWRRLFYIFVVYGLMLESLQAFRGLDPRFTEEGDLIDVIAGIVFGVTALSNTVLFVLLGLRFYRSDVLPERPVLRLAIRYGVAAVTLSFAVGILMSVNQGRDVGSDGNLLLSHALGVHGIQTIPLVALAIPVAVIAAAHTETWLHVAGTGWLMACIAAVAQALLDEPPLEPSLLSALIVAGVLVWAGTVGFLLLIRLRSGPRGSLVSTVGG